MNRHNRRAKPNYRHQVRFYKPGITTNSAGELVQGFSLHYSGYFSIELPIKPNEITEAARVVNEQISIVIGNWSRLSIEVTTGMYAFIPDRNKVYAVSGQATDPWGDRKKVHIYLADNVTQTMANNIIPGLYSSGT